MEKTIHIIQQRSAFVPFCIMLLLVIGVFLSLQWSIVFALNGRRARFSLSKHSVRLNCYEAAAISEGCKSSFFIVWLRVLIERSFHPDQCRSGLAVFEWASGDRLDGSGFRWQRLAKEDPRRIPSIRRLSFLSFFCNSKHHGICLFWLCTILSLCTKRLFSILERQDCFRQHVHISVHLHD